MLKIDKKSVDLKGLSLALTDGKNVIVLGKLDAVPVMVENDKGQKVNDPNDLTLHFVQGSKWAGDIIADLQDNMGLYFKGSLYSRKTAMSKVSQKVGSTL